MDTIQNPDYFKGRGAQVNTHNKFVAQRYVADHIEGLDEAFLENSTTQLINTYPKTIISPNDSPDVYAGYSLNPYQGCEHGCIYCYARNAHEYWGYSAGLDFERKIIVKRDAAAVLERQLNARNYRPQPIMLSGNTDCYQPVERKLGITRTILRVLLQHRHPVSIITKNNLILRDLDILRQLADLGLVHVAISLTTLQEELRQKMEPRTVTANGRLAVIRKLSDAGIPVMVMCAPLIPGLNSSEVPQLIEAAAHHGASAAGYTIVRLNGAIGELFADWVHKAYPDRADKVLHGIAACHGGKLNDSRFTTRMKGEGHEAETIRQLFKLSVKKHLAHRQLPPLRHDLFTPKGGKQLDLF